MEEQQNQPPNPNPEQLASGTPVQNTEPTPTAPKPKTEQVDVSKLTQEDPNMISVQWGTPSNPNKDDLFQGKTRPIADQPKAQPNNVVPITTPISNEKFKFGISVVVMVIDFALSNILCKIAGEGEKATSYTADTEGKKTFEESLVLLLDTKKDLIPTWLIVLLAFASAWGFQVMAAIQIRQQKAKPLTEKKDNPNEPSKPGLFIGTDGKVYRRYANGSTREANIENGREKIVGAPTRRKAA